MFYVTASGHRSVMTNQTIACVHPGMPRKLKITPYAVLGPVFQELAVECNELLKKAPEFSRIAPIGFRCLSRSKTTFM
jgi:hypothetical protein